MKAYSVLNLLHQLLFKSTVDGGWWLVSPSGCLSPPNELTVLWNRGLGGTQGWSGHCGEEITLLPLLVIEKMTPGSSRL